MFKLVGKLYRLYSKIMRIKTFMILFGLVAFVIVINIETFDDWYADEGDSLQTIPTDCYLAIADQPHFIPFQDYHRQALKTVSTGTLFNGTKEQKTWQLSLVKSHTYKVHHQNESTLSPKSTFTYRINEQQIEPISCSHSRWGVSVPASLLITMVLIYLLRRLTRRFKNKGEVQPKKKKPKRKPVSQHDEKAEQSLTDNAKQHDDKKQPKSAIESTKPQRNSVIDRK